MAKPDLQDIRINPVNGRFRRDNGKLGLKNVDFTSLPTATSNATAASAGVPVGGLYKDATVATSVVIKVRTA